MTDHEWLVNAANLILYPRRGVIVAVRALDGRQDGMISVTITPAPDDGACRVAFHDEWSDAVRAASQGGGL